MLFLFAKIKSVEIEINISNTYDSEMGANTNC